MYSRQKAVDYAYKWWNGRNPRFYNFDELGGDCTNFVSQCLNYGGIEMDYSYLGWFYADLNNRSPAWSGVDEFFEYSTKNSHAIGVRTKVVTADLIEVGDVVQMRQSGENGFHHTLLVTKILGKTDFDSILLTGHTNDVKDRAISSYNFVDIRFLKVLNDKQTVFMLDDN